MNSLQQELTHTLRHLYADIWDFPVLTLAPIEPKAAPQFKSEPSFTNPTTLHAFQESIQNCQNCGFYLGRKNLVFGKGQAGARVAFVGDLPSLEEDQAGSPFVGETGELLHKMILAMQLKPTEVYLTNFFKCRAPINKVPTRVELDSCEKHLQKQMEIVNPELIVAFGEIASKALARSEAPLAVLRKQEFEWFNSKVVCTHHPRELNSNLTKKREAWEDLKLVMKKLGLG